MEKYMCIQNVENTFIAGVIYNVDILPNGIYDIYHIDDTYFTHEDAQYRCASMNKDTLIKFENAFKSLKEYRNYQIDKLVC